MLKNQKKGEYSLISGFTRMTNKAIFKHNVCGYIWETTPNHIMNSKDKVHGGCPKCQYDRKRILKPKFIEKLTKMYGNAYVLNNSPKYTSLNKKAGFTHTICGTKFVATGAAVLANDVPCPKCSAKKFKKILTGTRKDYEKRLLSKYHGEYKLSEDSDFTNLLGMVTAVHTVCGTKWNVRASHLLYDSGCPVCCQSHGEAYIDYLLKNNMEIKYERQYKFKDCKYKKELPFDFAIIGENNKPIGLIEYDGIQHYQAFKHFDGKKGLEVRIKRDHVKNKYCLSNSIPLLRIKYSTKKSDIKIKIGNFIIYIESKAEVSLPK